MTAWTVIERIALAGVLFIGVGANSQPILLFGIGLAILTLKEQP